MFGCGNYDCKNGKVSSDSSYDLGRITITIKITRNHDQEQDHDYETEIERGVFASIEKDNPSLTPPFIKGGRIPLEPIAKFVFMPT